MDIEQLIALCADRNPPSDIKFIEALQNFLRLRFPDDYISYLLKQNGGFFRNVAIQTPWHPHSGDRLESIYHVNLKRVEESWDSFDGESDDYDLDDAVGCMQSVLLLQDRLPIRFLPIASTALGHLILMSFKNGCFCEINIKGAFIDEVQLYCKTFGDFLTKLNTVEN